MHPALLYLIIFVAKLFEVSIATVRVVLINRGEKLWGSFIAFFEVMIWVVVVNQVLTDLAADPFKLLVYCTAYALGNYVGSTIETKLAIGTSCMQAVVTCDKQEEVCENLRKEGFGVTLLEGSGKNGPVEVLMIFLKRKNVDRAAAIIKEHCPSSPISVNDVRHLRNGYLKKK